jgi:hypothetical protein
VEEQFICSFNYYKDRWASQARVIRQLPEASESVENAGAALSNFLKRKRASVANQTEEEFQRYSRF